MHSCMHACMANARDGQTGQTDSMTWLCKYSSILLTWSRVYLLSGLWYVSFVKAISSPRTSYPNPACASAAQRTNLG
jgi:hypothetical protein